MAKILTSRGPIDITLPTGSGEQYIICPICAESRKPEHRKEAKLSINMNGQMDSEANPMKWKCHHCGEGGHVHGNNSYERNPIRPLLQFPKPVQFGDAVFKWIKKARGLSAKTVNELGITISKESILQLKHPNPEIVGKHMESEAINFRYFYKEELINIKFRDARKNFKLIKGAIKIFYNLDSIKNSKWAVITEGEFDVGAYHEVGILPVVSVPNGVSLSKKEKEAFEKSGNVTVFSELNMEYMDICIHEFDHLEIIYIATDDDVAGIKLREELARRLGKHRCRFIRFSDYKKKDGDPVNDPNELLLEQGPEVLKNTLNHSYEFPIHGVTTAMDHWDEISRIYDNGHERGVSTGYASLDPYFNWMKGWTVAVNGYPSEGKTTAVLNLITITSVLYGFKWGIYSPENYPISNIIDSIAELLLNNTTNIEYNSPVKPRISKHELEIVTREHINKHFFFVDNEDGYSPEELRQVKIELVKKKGIVGFFTDPWSVLTHDLKANPREDIYLRNELNAETRLANTYKLINVISHHPPTPDNKNKPLEAPSPFNMIGGQIWFNKMYAILCIHKFDREDFSNPRTGIHVQKIKEHKLAGIPTNKNTPVMLYFDRRSGRLLERERISDVNSEYNSFPFKKWKIKDNTLFEDI
jgi:twinkle protein